MYRLFVKRGRKWVWGIREYDSLEAAEARVRELEAVGIKSRVRRNEELFG